MYALKDDQGTIKEGDLKVCIVEITNWLSSSAAINIYSRSEISAAKKEFYSGLSKRVDRVEALGFVVERI